MKDFFHHIINEQLNDVIVTGFMEFDKTAVFHPMYERLFFVFSKFIYEVYMGDDGVLQADKKDNIDLWFDIDEDDQFSQMSLYYQLFKTEYEVKILDIHYKYIPFSTLLITYRAGNTDNILILDPKNFCGFTFL